MSKPKPPAPPKPDRKMIEAKASALAKTLFNTPPKSGQPKKKQS